MTTTIEFPKMAIRASTTFTSPSATFAVWETKLNGPTHLDGTPGDDAIDLAPGDVIWIERQQCDFALQLAFPAGAVGMEATCTGDATINAAWTGSTATFPFLAIHEGLNFAVYCVYRSSKGDIGDEVTITVRVRRGTGPVFGDELAAPAAPRGPSTRT